ncbi:serine/threonine-protein kinase [Actinomycetes bacterium KLBMP 9759]
MVDDRWLGAELAGYRIEALIGHGGAGMVYRATQIRLRRPAAVKLLAPSLAADDEFRRRFEREARLAAGLEHPHIVPIYDSGFADGVLFLTMRYIDGPNLATAVDSNGPMQLHQVCELLTGIAEALDSAHHAGLVHRDVKPANVLLAAPTWSAGRRHAYLCDFGIARHTAAGSTLTTVGEFLGTLSYCAPEQLQAQPVDGRTDQYALACVAYFCLTGRAPFTADEPSAVMFAHIFATPPAASTHSPDLPRAVDDVLARALAKQPADRFADCSTFLHALAAATGPVAPPPPLPGQPVPAADETIVRPAVEPVTTRIRPELIGPDTRRRVLRALVLAGIPLLAVIIAVIVAVATSWAPPARDATGAGSPSTSTATPQVSPPTSSALSLPISDPRLVDTCALLSGEQFAGFGKVTAGPGISVSFNRCVLALSLTTGGTAKVNASFVELDGRTIDARPEQPGGLPVSRHAATGCPRQIMVSDSTVLRLTAEVHNGSADACALTDLATAYAVRVLMDRGVPHLPSAGGDANSLRRLHACALLGEETVRRVPALDPARRIERFGDWSCTWGNDPYANGFRPPAVVLEFQWPQPVVARENERRTQLGNRTVYIGPTTSNDHPVCTATIVHRDHPLSTGEPAQEIVQIGVYAALPSDEQCRLAQDLAAAVVPQLPPP